MAVRLIVVGNVTIKQVTWLVTKTRVASQILEKNFLLFLTCCYGNALNLVVGGMIRAERLLIDPKDITSEPSKLISKLPKQDAMLFKVTEELS